MRKFATKWDKIGQKKFSLLKSTLLPVVTDISFSYELTVNAGRGDQWWQGVRAFHIPSRWLPTIPWGIPEHMQCMVRLTNTVATGQHPPVCALFSAGGFQDPVAQRSSWNCSILCAYVLPPRVHLLILIFNPGMLWWSLFKVYIIFKSQRCLAPLPNCPKLQAQECPTIISYQP